MTAVEELGTALQIRPASIGELVTKLENGGFAERRGAEQDRRIIEIYLTEKGRETAQNIIKNQQQTYDEWFPGLTSEEKQQLLALLIRLTKNLEKSFAKEGELDDFTKDFGWGAMGSNDPRFFDESSFDGSERKDFPFGGRHRHGGFDFPRRK